MPTDEENLAELKGIKGNLIALIKEVTSAPKPNYTIDGQKVDWSDYLEMLYRQLKANEELITTFDEPYEKTSTIYT